jgi:four helix bundle protein
VLAAALWYGVPDGLLDIAAMEPYERFAAWRCCHQLVLDVYGASERWPSHERYGLVAQARRAAFSAAVNIAEGSAKRGPAEFRRFIDISIGSIAEVGYTLRVARDLVYLEPTAWEELERTRSGAAVMTWRLYRSLGHR